MGRQSKTDDASLLVFPPDVCPQNFIVLCYTHFPIALQEKWEDSWFAQQAKHASRRSREEAWGRHAQAWHVFLHLVVYLDLGATPSLTLRKSKNVEADDMEAREEGESLKDVEQDGCR